MQSLLEDVDYANLKEAQAALGVAQTNLKDTEMYAPADGTILTRIREPGTVVREADPIYTLSLISPVWVRAYVSEPQLGLIYPGMPAEVYTDTPGGKIYKGQLVLFLLWLNLLLKQLKRHNCEQILSIAYESLWIILIMDCVKECL